MLATMSVLGLYQYDNTLFDALTLPDGIDRETVVSSIIAQCAGLPTMYPNPDIFKLMLKAWTARKLPIWERLYKTTQLEYNPIENYDRIEEWEDESAGNGDGSSRDSATAFNSERLKTAAGNEYESRTSNKATHKGRTHGNIGVTSAQTMIMQEREISTFDIYEVITSDFADAFCVGVY